MVRIWPALRRILIALGRWILGLLQRRGIMIGTEYMLERVEVFKLRLGRVKGQTPRAQRRRRWLRGRIRRWTRAAAWLLEHQKELHERALCEYEKLAAKLPENSPLEREPRAA